MQVKFDSEGKTAVKLTQAELRYMDKAMRTCGQLARVLGDESTVGHDAKDAVVALANVTSGMK